MRGAATSFTWLQMPKNKITNILMPSSHRQLRRDDIRQFRHVMASAVWTGHKTRPIAALYNAPQCAVRGAILLHHFLAGLSRTSPVNEGLSFSLSLSLSLSGLHLSPVVVDRLSRSTERFTRQSSYCPFYTTHVTRRSCRQFLIIGWRLRRQDGVLSIAIQSALQWPLLAGNICASTLRWRGQFSATVSV